MSFAPTLCLIQPAANAVLGPVLTSAEAQARLEGLLFETRLTQHYRNTGASPLEVQYSFPLPAGATLLGLSVDWNGRRLAGCVLPGSEAETRYEAALDDGDSPVLVRDDGHGLYTAQLGNLLPGESARLELHFAQAVSPVQGRLRLSLPTTLTPRYGDPQHQGGLPVHVNAPHSTAARYPFAVTVDLVGEAAQARIHSPSHTVSLHSNGAGAQARLEGEGWLDRDFVLVLEDLPALDSALVCPDGDETVVMASFVPPPTTSAPLALRLKLLVDCSGSMNGDSMQLARQALHALLARLDPHDLVSLSRFGGRTEHLLGSLEPCRPQRIKALARAIARLNADLGGTELELALEQVGALGDADGVRAGTDILLITDGATWNIDRIVQRAGEQGQRILAVGVGSAPGESLLRELAEASGGACEFVGTGESMENAVQRHVDRLRAPRLGGLRIDWGTNPRWQSRLTTQLFAGDTVHAFAWLDQVPDQAPVLHWSTNGETCSTRASALLRATSMLPRLAASLACAQSPSEDQARALALRYQLVTRHTHLFLVHERSAQAKAAGLPALHEVPSMHAAGAAGFGSTFGAHSRVGGLPEGFDFLGVCSDSRSIPPPREITLAVQASHDAPRPGGKLGRALSSVLRRGRAGPAVPEAPTVLPPGDLLDKMVPPVLNGVGLAGLDDKIPVARLPAGVESLLEAVGPKRPRPARLLLLLWILSVQLLGSEHQQSQQLEERLIEAGWLDPWPALRTFVGRYSNLTRADWEP